MSEDIQTLKWSDQACSREAAEKHLVTKARESSREQERRLRGVVEKLASLGQENPMQTAPEDAETRRGLKRSAELPIDDPRSEVRGCGLRLDDDVPDCHADCTTD